MHIKSSTMVHGSDSIELLASIMVRYPELGTINFEPTQRVLKFTFILAEVIGAQEIKLFHQKLIASVETFHYLEGRKIDIIELNINKNVDFTFLEISRDMTTLVYDEIGLIMAVIKQQFGHVLLTEECEGRLEEELSAQDDCIREMLENLRYCIQDKKLVALRDDGRVLVFNK